MFQKVKPYMGEYTRYTKRAAVAVTAAVILSVVPYFFLYHRSENKKSAAKARIYPQ